MRTQCAPPEVPTGRARGDTVMVEAAGIEPTGMFGASGTLPVLVPDLCPHLYSLAAR